MINARRSCLVLGLVLAVVCLMVLLATADRRVLLLGRNSLWLSLGVCVVCLPTGTFLALLLVRSDFPWRRAVWLLLITQLLMPLYLHAAAWDASLSRWGGYSWLGAAADASPLRGWLAAVWIHALWSIPWVALIVATVLWQSEPEWEEAALLDAPAWIVCWRVTLRRALPGVIVAGVWVMLMTAAEMTVTDLYQIRTLAEELYTGFALSMPEEPVFGAGTAVLMTGVLAGLKLAALDVLVINADRAPMRPSFCFRLGRWRWWLVPAWLVFLLVLVVVPVGNLIHTAGMVVRQVDGELVRSWSPSQLVELCVPLPGSYQHSAIWQFADDFGWTLLIGSAAASLSVGLAVVLGWWGRAGSWRALPAAVAAALGLATLGPLIGLALIGLFTRGDQPWLVWMYDRTLVAPVLAAAARAMPLPILICYVAFRTLRQELLDVATLEGAGPLTRLCHVGLRQRLPALAVAWLIALAIACGELPATILVIPPGVRTVPIRVFGLLHAGVTDHVAAICLTNMAIFLMVAFILLFLAPHLFGSVRRPGEWSDG